MIWRELSHMGAKSIDIRWPRHLSLYHQKQAINHFNFKWKSINRVHKRILHTYCNYRISRYAYLSVSRWINYPPQNLLHVEDKIHTLAEVLERRRSTTYQRDWDCGMFKISGPSDNSIWRYGPWADNDSPCIFIWFPWSIMSGCEIKWVAEMQQSSVYVRYTYRTSGIHTVPVHKPAVTYIYMVYMYYMWYIEYIANSNTTCCH